MKTRILSEPTETMEESVFADPYVVKCALIGDYGVGKSTLGHVFIEGLFSSVTSTIGISFFAKTIVLPEYNRQKLKLQIWDTAGSEKYRSIVRTYLRDVYLAVVMFDMTERSTWESVDRWKDLIEDSKRYESVPHIVLVGTKSDKNYYAVSEREIRNKAKKWGCNYYILSSKLKTSHNTISQMFLTETRILHQKLIKAHSEGIEIPPRILRENVERITNLYETNTGYLGGCCS